MQLTSAAFASTEAKKGEAYIVSRLAVSLTRRVPTGDEIPFVGCSADGGEKFTICILRAGVCDQVAIDIMLGAGNQKVNFFVSGGAFCGCVLPPYWRRFSESAPDGI